MTKAQELKRMIIELEEQEVQLKESYHNESEKTDILYEELKEWDRLYCESGEDETIGMKLDEVCAVYDEAYDIMDKTGEKLETIEETLQALRKVVENIEWLGL